jgi:hypothetical protein
MIQPDGRAGFYLWISYAAAAATPKVCCRHPRESSAFSARFRGFTGILGCSRGGGGDTELHRKGDFGGTNFGNWSLLGKRWWLTLRETPPMSADSTP